MSSKTRDWCVYIVSCSDGSFYTGITNNLERRINAHNAGTGARYTKTRRPVSLEVYKGEFTKSEALKLEAKIKKMPRSKKIAALSSLELVTDV